MKTILSKVFYYMGDFVSKFLYWECFGWLYPFYNKLMIISVKLDKGRKVWKSVE